MTHSRRFVLGLALFGTLSGSVWAQASVGTPDEAKKLVAAAAQHAKKVGVDQATKDFADKQWVVKDLTVWMMDYKGVMRYHVSPAMVGKDLLEVKDGNGRAFTKDMVAIAKGGQAGSYDYMWPHPETKKLVKKTAFVHPIAGTDYFVGVSISY